MAVATTILDDRAAVEPHRAGWDALAVACARPYCAPDWMLSWWDHARPAGAELRVVVAVDDGELIAVAPLWRGSGGRHEALTSTLSPPAGPLLAPGREVEAA